jgi:hypothetical protein
VGKTLRKAMLELFMSTSQEVAKLVSRRKVVLGFVDSAWTTARFEA